METEISNNIEYNPELDIKQQDIIEHHDEQQLYHPQFHPQFNELPKQDFFSSLDKTSYILIFIAFILGFFMGKTMQPVILRNV